MNFLKMYTNDQHMGQHHDSYTKYIPKSDTAKKPWLCNLCSECSKFYPWNKPDYQKTEYSGYSTSFLIQLNFISKSLAYIL